MVKLKGFEAEAAPQGALHEAPLVDVKYLRFLDVLYRTRRLSHAAELLGQSAPTMSIWLAALRELTGDPLFVRTPAGMQPTPRVETMMPLVRSALAAMATKAETLPWPMSGTEL